MKVEKFLSLTEKTGDLMKSVVIGAFIVGSILGATAMDAHAADKNPVKAPQESSQILKSQEQLQGVVKGMNPQLLNMVRQAREQAGVNKDGSLTNPKGSNGITKAQEQLNGVKEGINPNLLNTVRQIRKDSGVNPDGSIFNPTQSTPAKLNK